MAIITASLNYLGANSVLSNGGFPRSCAQWRRARDFALRAEVKANSSLWWSLVGTDHIYLISERLLLLPPEETCARLDFSPPIKRAVCGILRHFLKNVQTSDRNLLSSASTDECSGLGGRLSASGSLEVLGERMALGVLATASRSVR
ncbi:hypothetical protein IRJ41_018077 [Triplophysa rosa]|uniref:Uncharacterized protein n=1 Tax=Triplophysa rosa TaxID=992332 RepID=A0A9W7WLG2_TRIRA|nr:hypothetical protein IRJ41_018077 [Triplophysa rosa]